MSVKLNLCFLYISSANSGLGLYFPQDVFLPSSLLTFFFSQVSSERSGGGGWAERGSAGRCAEHELPPWLPPRGVPQQVENVYLRFVINNVLTSNCFKRKNSGFGINQCVLKTRWYSPLWVYVFQVGYFNSKISKSEDQTMPVFKSRTVDSAVYFSFLFYLVVSYIQ